MTWSELTDRGRIPLVKILDEFELDDASWVHVLMWDDEEQFVEKFILSKHLKEFYVECRDDDLLYNLRHIKKIEVVIPIELTPKGLSMIKGGSFRDVWKFQKDCLDLDDEKVEIGNEFLDRERYKHLFDYVLRLRGGGDFRIYHRGFDVLEQVKH